MSRWIDQFSNHAFQATWMKLKDVLEKAFVDDETVITSVKELARLKKVVSYVDEILTGMDPEIVPGSIWDNFNTQSTACLQHINNYATNRNISHVQQANAHADNLLTYVRPYMVAPGKAATALANAVKKYASTIDEYAVSFKERADGLVLVIKNYESEASEILDGARGAKSAIDKFKSKLFGDEETIGLQQKVDGLVDDFSKKHQGLSEFHDQMLVGDESTKGVVAKAKAAILEDRDEIEELLGQVESETEELTKFHTKMFGKPDEEGKRVGGLSSDLDERILVLSGFEGEQKAKYKALNDEIESLLPGATSAGLATAYRELKESFDGPIRNASLIFYLSIGLLVTASAILAVDSLGGDRWITFVEFTEWDVVLKGIVYKIPFYAPILWLAFYATKRRSEYQRLQQEYAHKEALAKSYNSYKKQLEELDDKDFVMLKGFIMKAIDAIAYNASATLDGKHGDNMPTQEVLEKLADSLSRAAVSAESP